eukprot:5785744-Pyramimonas_sp.AAC.1
MVPKMPQDGSECAQRGPNAAPRRPRWATYLPKEAPKKPFKPCKDNARFASSLHFAPEPSEASIWRHDGPRPPPPREPQESPNAAPKAPRSAPRAPPPEGD